MVAGASCSQVGSISDTALSSVMEQQEPGAGCGVSSLLETPRAHARHPLLLPGSFRRARHLDRSSEELCCGSLCQLSIQALGCQHSQPICSRGTLPAHKLSDNFTGARRTWT